ncbi:MAG TPA: phospholipase D-like domain-containing protein [Burkholderiaceae bacterium]
MRHVTFTPGNEVDLLLSGAQFYPALIEQFEQATSEIYFETYIFAEDDTGALIKAALIRAAKRGVRVRMITDWYGTGRRCINCLHDTVVGAGIEHRMFNPWFRRGVSRSHRKICVVDRRVAFVGGLNVNDDMRSDTRPDIPLPAPRWDVATRIRGPLVAVIHREAESQWARVGRLDLATRIEIFRDMFPRKAAPQAGPSGTLAGFVVRDNLRNRSTIQRAYLQAMGLARTSIVLANPYFAPGRKMRNALIKAARRGVSVTLLIGVGEFALQDAVAHSFYPRLLAAGIKLVEYRKSQLHGKVAVVDDEWATVGSSNCDGLSLFVNQEANIVVRDAQFARDLRLHIDAAIADGVVIRSEEYANIGWHRRLGFGFSYLVYKGLMRIFTIGKYS